MATSMEMLYSRFLGKISDYKFTLMQNNQTDIENMLFGFYTSANVNFLQCNKDLSTNYSSHDVVPYDEVMMINGDLSPLELEILSKLMLVEYIKPIIIRNETLEQALSDSDFTIYSQANHINQLQSLYNNTRKEVNADLVRYSFMRTKAYDR